MDKFNELLKKYISNPNPYLDWNKIELIDENILSQQNDLEIVPPNCINELQTMVCVIKLNGGLGTTMGCNGPKSLLQIKDSLTFMEIIINQHKLLNKIPLVLMNSFYTHEATNDYLINNNLAENINLISFNQNYYGRIIKETMTPLDINSTNKDYLYPPGHGDLLQSLYDTKTLDKLINMGIKYAFISNIDNLGSTMNYEILNDLIKHDVDFALELTTKTIDDIKGGTLIKYQNEYKMFEVAQCPRDKLDQFMSIDKFKYFNTNNTWIKLESIKKLVQTDYFKDIDVIVNPKKLKDGRECIQLEYAIGSMVKFFTNVKCYLVSRDRYIPVKTNDNLNTIKSDKYSLNKETWKLAKR